MRRFSLLFFLSMTARPCRPPRATASRDFHGGQSETGWFSRPRAWSGKCPNAVISSLRAIVLGKVRNYGNLLLFSGESSSFFLSASLWMNSSLYAQHGLSRRHAQLLCGIDVASHWRNHDFILACFQWNSSNILTHHSPDLSPNFHTPDRESIIIPPGQVREICRNLSG